MTTAYTSLLGLALPVTGELSGTWGDTVNNSITSLLDSAIAGTTTLSSDADVTLTTTTGASNTSRQAILLWTAGGTVTRNITAPAQSKIYTVINASSSTQSIVLRGAGPTTGVTIVKGESAVCAWNGSDFIKISNTGGAAVFTTLDVTNLEVTNIKALDGTSAASIANSTGVISLTANPILSGGTANGVAYLNGSKVLTTGSVLTFDGTTLRGGNILGVNTTTFATDSRLAIQTASGKFDVAAYGGSSVQLISSGALAYYTPSSSFDHIWLQGASDLMRLTSTGLGIGTSSPSSKLHVSGTEVRLQGSASFYSFYDNAGTTRAGYIQNNTGALSFVGELAQPMQFYTNNTEKMRIDSSGNLLVGATAPYTAAFTGISVQGLTSGTGNLSLGLNKAGTPQILSGDVLGNIYFYGVDNDVTAGNNNIGARIASIATTNWTTDGTTSNAALVFYTHGTTSGAPEERARIDSSGNLLVGTTDANPNSGNGVKINAGTGARTSVVGSADTNANFTFTAYSTGAAAYRFQVGYGGTIYATSTSITAISDASLKTNVRDLETGLTEVMALQPRRFDWINGDASNVAGFIAQEVKQVLPDLVEDYQYSDEETKLGLKMGDILPTLVKAIQEQQALITQLTARITALEGA